VPHEFLLQGQAVNLWYYLEVLKCLRENVRRKRPQLCRKNSWFLHDDNVPAHALLPIREFLANTNTPMLPQPPYSPDLAPADFLISQTAIHFERTMISDYSKDYRKFEDGTTCDPEKGIQGLFPEVAGVLGVLHQCSSRVL
jgi:hypothetical protein